MLFFQDDILVFSVSVCGYNRVLNEVLKRLVTAGLTMQQDKCKFPAKEVDYLGYTLSESGIKPK